MGMEVVALMASPRRIPESRRDNGYTLSEAGSQEGIIPRSWFSGLDKVVHTESDTGKEPN
jgi:hypothetical protein